MTHPRFEALHSSAEQVPSGNRSAREQAHVFVVGPGVFGRALAMCALQAGSFVTILGLNEESLSEARAAFAEKQDVSFLTMNPESLAAVQGIKVDLIILAVPCQALRSVSQWCRDVLWPVLAASCTQGTHKIPVLCAAKGIELQTLKLPHEILSEFLPDTAGWGILSGPSFAKELQAGLPTAIVVASQQELVRRTAERLLHRPHFRVYGTDDVVGVELGGALKNVIAVVAGVVDGLQLGHNARAAVVTRGLGEMAQMGAALGARPMTFLGLSGLGDLILTCTGDLSRNRRFGLTVAQHPDRPVSESLADIGQTVEGYSTAKSAKLLSEKLKLDTPILDMAYEVLYENRPVRAAVEHLLNRGQKGEFDWIGE